MHACYKKAEDFLHRWQHEQSQASTTFSERDTVVKLNLQNEIELRNTVEKLKYEAEQSFASNDEPHTTQAIALCDMKLRLAMWRTKCGWTLCEESTHYTHRGGRPGEEDL